ncbi:TrkA family potassium uptake protein [Acinetobacter sp. MD2(2019)]|uniref:potassium channel family protein n=1 Tax=Acinetobacter sp. MD2(2019) TaxID=2605273 RepID=UPI002D1E697C|nr:TrkA family potassium uptake protein [Acinetobacter sp. MD2(2019)]MEB3754212.1 TrkA family potassium uptake protein [Acinetobacter sp. MD2(2019)]
MAIFTVIGLGSFGQTIALELTKLGHDVIGIDTEQRNIEQVADHITHAVIADATDEKVLEELNVQKSEAAIVAIGEDIEASILCVLNLKNLDIQHVWVKAKTKSHHTILSHLGVDKIIHPEEDMGIRIAQTLSYPMVSRYMALEHDHYIVKVVISEHMKGVHLHGLMGKYAQSVHILLLKRNQEIFYHLPEGFTLEPEDILIVEGLQQDLQKLSSSFK